MSGLISTYGVWVVALFVALESIGLPLPAELALIAVAALSSDVAGADLWFLVAIAVGAAIVGNLTGFWIGRRYGAPLLSRYGRRVGMGPDRIKIGQWLFQRYGALFVFVARFLPFLRNLAAILAGTNAMAPRRFVLASTLSATAWVLLYAYGARQFGDAFRNASTMAALLMGGVGLVVVLAVPAVVLRFEKRILQRAERDLSATRSP